MMAKTSEKKIVASELQYILWYCDYLKSGGYKKTSDKLMQYNKSPMKSINMELGNKYKLFK